MAECGIESVSTVAGNLSIEYAVVSSKFWYHQKTTCNCVPPAIECFHLQSNVPEDLPHVSCSSNESSHGMICSNWTAHGSIPS